MQWRAVCPPEQFMTAESHCRRGDELARQNQMPAAITEFRAAINLQPGYALAHFFLGTALRIIGQLEAATECYRQAVELKPDYTKAWEKLGEILLDRRRLAEAAAACQRAVALSPTALNYANLGSALGGSESTRRIARCHAKGDRIGSWLVGCVQGFGLYLLLVRPTGRGDYCLSQSD